MKITCISDLHGHYPELSGGDLLIVAGDLTAGDMGNDWMQVCIWLMDQKYKKIIVVAGNHDNCLKWNKENVVISEDHDSRIQYLRDSGTEFEGLKIWGSPWSLWFHGINPKCKAFTGSEKDLAKKFALIPDDIDILITHSPPYAILDIVKKNNSNSYENVGSKALAEKVGHMKNLPKLWVWGHIHECYGTDLPVRHKRCIMINASHVNENYEPVNKPIDIVL